MNNPQSLTLEAVASFSVPMSVTDGNDERTDAYAAALALMPRLRASSFNGVVITAAAPQEWIDDLTRRFASHPYVRLWPCMEGVAEALAHLDAWRGATISYAFAPREGVERSISVEFTNRPRSSSWRVPTPES